MTVVPSGREWDAMRTAFVGAYLKSDSRIEAEKFDAGLLAALRAVTTEPCDWPQCVCGNDGTPTCPRPVHSFAAPRVLVDLEVLEPVGAQPIIADDLGSAEWKTVFAVRPVEAE